jgi:hypothetical protein
MTSATLPVEAEEEEEEEDLMDFIYFRLLLTQFLGA